MHCWLNPHSHVTPLTCRYKVDWNDGTDTTVMAFPKATQDKSWRLACSNAVCVAPAAGGVGLGQLCVAQEDIGLVKEPARADHLQGKVVCEVMAGWVGCCEVSVCEVMAGGFVAMRCVCVVMAGGWVAARHVCV